MKVLLVLWYIPWIIKSLWHYWSWYVIIQTRILRIRSYCSWLVWELLWEHRKQFVRYQACDSEYKDKVWCPSEIDFRPTVFHSLCQRYSNCNFIIWNHFFLQMILLLYSYPDIATKIHLINQELSEIYNWFKANKLSINASKTKYMVLGTSHTTNKYAYGSLLLLGCETKTKNKNKNKNKKQKPKTKNKIVRPQGTCWEATHELVHLYHHQSRPFGAR